VLPEKSAGAAFSLTGVTQERPEGFTFRKGTITRRGLYGKKRKLQRRAHLEGVPGDLGA